MKRRAFLSLAGAAGTLPLWPGSVAAAQQGVPWRFEVDERLGWRLTRGSEVAAAGGAPTVELDGSAIPIGALEGVRRFRGGGRDGLILAVTGRAADTEITAEFVGDEAAPRITIRVRGLGPGRALGSVTFLDTAHGAQLPALRRPGATAWINGFQSWSSCRVVPAATADATGHWQLALTSGAPGLRGTGGPAGLGLVFGENDSGFGEFVLREGQLVAAARCGGRPVGSGTAPASCTLAFTPAADPLAALGRLAAFDAPRLPTAVPSGWCSWYELFGAVTEADVLASLEVARRRFDRTAFGYIQLDDGFQRSCGDWDMNDKFPHGHVWLTEQIRQAGFKPGLWLAPFAVAERSGIPRLHPDWLLRRAGGELLVLDERDDWGGKIYGFDAEVDEAREYLRLLARHAVQYWGYEYLKLDFLYYAALGDRPGRRWSRAETYRAGMRALKAGAGSAFVLGCGAPLQHALGLVDGMRIGADIDASFGGIQVGVRAALQRAHLHRRAWLNDPDALVVREPLTLGEARMWATATALSGGMTVASDRLERLTDSRLELVMRTMPALPITGVALDLAAPERGHAPALVSGTRVAAALPPRWRFRTGDEPAWSDPAFDDSAWEELPYGTAWERAGKAGYDGYAWYRVRFAAPAQPRGTDQLWLELGRIDDVDEAFFNGSKVGHTGTFPPEYRTEWQTYRRYWVPPELVRWGGANVVAVRVYDGGGGGGAWRLTRDEPPSWMFAPVAQDRFMVAAFNWTDDEQRMTTALGARLRGTFAAYDVWRDARGADVRNGALSLLVPPHSVTCLGLRRPRSAAPFVLGTNRHIVQGLHETAAESWNGRRRTLAGRSTGLDGRAHTVTIAVPAGMHPRGCSGSVGCTVVHPHGAGAAGARTAQLSFDVAEEVEWEVRF